MRRCGRPRLVETHISTLFFVGDRVYKLRKPVQFGFLDFRSRTTRLDDCEREVSLNRRLAPDVYLGVADLSMEGQLLDHMVVMRRMPAGSSAGHARPAGGRPRPVAPAGWRKRWSHFMPGRSARQRSRRTQPTRRCAALWQESFDETDRFVGSMLDDDDETEIRALVARWIEGRKPLLDARIASGRVCDGHGDLQAEDIFCLDDGVRILDCIEFSDRLRHGDVCADVTFLAMDLERLDRPEAANRFLLRLPTAGR